MSKVEDSLQSLIRTIKEVLQTAMDPEGLIAGNVYEAKTRCGHPNCKCMNSSYRHRNRCVSFKQDGKSRTRTVPDAVADGVQNRAAAYRKARRLRANLGPVADNLFKEIDGIMATAVERGQRRMLHAIAEARRTEK